MEQIPDIKVKLCTLTDYPQILRIAKIVIKEAYPEEQFNEDKIKDCFFRTLNNEEYFCIGLEVDNAIKGFSFFTLSELLFVKKKVCICLAIYVEKQYRRHALGLFKGMEYICKANNIDRLIVHTLDGLSPKNMDKFLRRLNFKTRETGYWKEVI